MLTKDSAQVTGQIHRADQRTVKFPVLKLAEREFERPDSGAFFAGDREAGTTDAEFAGNSAGYDAAQRAHGAVGAQRRADRSAEL